MATYDIELYASDTHKKHKFAASKNSLFCYVNTFYGISDRDY